MTLLILCDVQNLAGGSPAATGLDNLPLRICGCKSLATNRLCARCRLWSRFGVIDVLMTVSGKHPECFQDDVVASFLQPLRRRNSGSHGYVAGASCPDGRDCRSGSQPARRLRIEFLFRGSGDRSASRRTDGMGGEDVGSLVGELE